MSILDYPRANFRGVFNTNPCTANNDDVMPSVVDGVNNTLGKDLQGKTDDEALQYLGQCVEMQNYADPPGKKPFIRAGWNPYGDHTTQFDDAFVRSVVYGPGEAAASPREDPLVGVKIDIIGSQNPDGSANTGCIICDLDPTGLVTTQLFVGGISFSYKNDKGEPAVVDIHHDTRGYQDWLNFNSTVGPYSGEQNFVGIGCVWQFAIPKEKLPAYGEFGLTSPALQALLERAQAEGGLALRFRCFEVEPGYTDQYLSQQNDQGNAVANRALGYLVGTLGVWNSDEPQTEPAGRKLEAPYREASPEHYINPDDPDQGRPDMSWAADRNLAGATTVPGCPYPWMGAPALIGNAVAKVREEPPVISLDLVSAFPKYGFRNPEGPNANNPPQGFDAPRRMAWVGEVELALVSAEGGEVIPVADIDYGYDDYGGYENFGGVVDLEYCPCKTPYAALAAGQLIVRGKPGGNLNAGTVLVRETSIRVVTDDRTAYLTARSENYPLKVKVYERGGPPSRDVALYLREYKNIIQLMPNTADACGSPDNQYRPNQSVDSRTAPLTDPGNPPQCPPAAAQSPLLLTPGVVVVPAGQDGWFTIPVSTNPGNEGAAILALQQEGDYVYGTIPPASPGGAATLAVAGVPMWSTKNYSSVRVFEDEAKFKGLYNGRGELQWADVYEHALRFYYLLFPAMSTYIPLNYASSVTSPYAGKLIKQRLSTPDQPMFYSTLNMPATRTLSPGRVRLVLDFIDQEQAKRKT